LAVVVVAVQQTQTVAVAVAVELVVVVLLLSLLLLRAATNGLPLHHSLIPAVNKKQALRERTGSGEKTEQQQMPMQHHWTHQQFCLQRESARNVKIRGRRNPAKRNSVV
jgi:hypothetical protein